jgi:hypothetical protein
VHDLTGFLKQWLRDLPDPLVSPDILNEMYEAGDNARVVDVLANIPPINRKCLAVISDLVMTIIGKESKNQMGVGNMTTCFAGSLCQNQKGLVKSVAILPFLEECHRRLNAFKMDFIL